MKKNIILVSFCIILGLFFFSEMSFVFAKVVASDCKTYCDDTATYDPPAGKICICNPFAATTFEELLDNIANFIFWVGMALAPVLLIVAGLWFVTAAGNPGRIDTAKRMILYTIIGVVVLLLAKGLIVVLKSILGA